MPTLVSTGQVTIVDLNDGVSLVLSNSAHVVPADAAGVVSSFAGATTTIKVVQGNTDVTASWALSKADTSCTSALASGTVTVSALSADVGYVDVTATRSGWPTLTARFTVTKAKSGTAGADGAAGAPGAAGQNATAYWMARSAAAVSVNAAGAYTPAAVTFSAFAATGTAAPAAYAGRFIIATTTDGTTYTDQYTSSANEASKAYTVPAGIKALRCRLYLAGGTTTLLDEEIVPVVTDGRGINLADASWWSPSAAFQWAKNDDVTGETSIVWAAGIKGQTVPVVKCIADSINKLYQPDVTGAASFWFPAQTVTGTADTFATDATVVYTGSSSFKLTKSTLATTARGRASRAIAVTPGQQYRIRVAVRGDSTTASGVYVRVHQAASLPATGAINESNRSGFTTVQDNFGVTANTWVVKSLTYTVPAGVNAISLAVFSWTNGPLNLWFDEPVINLASGTDSALGPRSNKDGGWTSSAANAIPIDPAKTYRFVVPVLFENAAVSASLFWGPENASKVCQLNTSTLQSNPYFASTTALTAGRWYLMVGYVYPAGSTGATSADAGIYDTTTGAKVAAGTNFCWAAGVTSCAHRAYQYVADNGAVTYFGAPQVHVVDGSEPLLRTWLAAGTSDIAVNAVTDVVSVSVAGPITFDINNSSGVLAIINYGPIPSNAKISVSALAMVEIATTNIQTGGKLLIDSYVGGISAFYDTIVRETIGVTKQAISLNSVVDYFEGSNTWISLVGYRSIGDGSVSYSNIFLKIEVIKR